MAMMMVTAMMMVVTTRGKRRSGTHQQQEGGDDNLLHACSVARFPVDKVSPTTPSGEHEPAPIMSQNSWAREPESELTKVRNFGRPMEFPPQAYTS